MNKEFTLKEINQKLGSYFERHNCGDRGRTLIVTPVLNSSGNVGSVLLSLSGAISMTLILLPTSIILKE